MRIAGELVLPKAHLGHHGAGGLLAGGGVAAMIDGERLHQDGTDGLARVQRTIGVLEHHLHLSAQRAGLAGDGLLIVNA